MNTPRLVPHGLEDAFRDYERALMADDTEALDRLFAPDPTTLRGDADGLLVGHDAISAFRRSRGGAPSRRLVQTHVTVIDDDHALIVAVTEPDRGGRGLQTQLWTRRSTGWVVSTAHVSTSGPAIDTRVWREVGAPLVAATGEGPLSGETVAVKDLYAVAGHRRGAGNPAWLAAAPVETTHADAVTRLLAAGADVTGLTQTDEFAYSLAGTNAHWGTPPNPRAPGRIPGGSSSGSATATARGEVTIGLGTDTGGSIRVPASYQGLFGIRTTHGAVDRAGLLPLAPSYDTVGWFARDALLLERVGDVLLPDGRQGGVDAIVVPALSRLADPVVATVVGAVARSWPGAVTTVDAGLADLPAWRQAFTAHQAWEAWQAHGQWLTDRLDTLGADVRARFEMASRITPEQADAARVTLGGAREQILELVGDHVLLMPSASSVAPEVGGDLDSVREATLRLTCLAGIAGLPAVSVPRVSPGGLPVGVCLVAAPGRDRDLVRYAAELTGPVTSVSHVLPRVAAGAEREVTVRIEEFDALAATEAAALVRACADVDPWVDALVSGRPWAKSRPC